MLCGIFYLFIFVFQKTCVLEVFLIRGKVFFDISNTWKCRCYLYLHFAIPNKFIILNFQPFTVKILNIFWHKSIFMKNNYQYVMWMIKYFWMKKILMFFYVHFQGNYMFTYRKKFQHIHTVYWIHKCTFLAINSTCMHKNA